MTKITMKFAPETCDALVRLQAATKSAQDQVRSYRAKRKLRAGEVVTSIDIDIDADLFDPVVFTKSRQIGLTAYRDFQKHLHGQISKSRGISYEEMSKDYEAARRSLDYADALRYAHTAALCLTNSRFGKFGVNDVRVPWLYPDTTFNFIDPIKEPNDMSIIPPLNIPEAPTPEVTPAAPESASVKMLRKLLAERKDELQRFIDAKDNDEKFVVNLEAKIERVRLGIAAHERGIAAAAQAIEEIEVDITLLKGSTAAQNNDTIAC